MTQLGVVQFLLNLFGLVVSNWWIWLPLVATFGYLAWQNYRRTQFAMKTDYQLLSFVIPDSLTDSAQSADALFASLHDILRPRKEIIKDGVIQEHISFEIAVLSQQTFYFLWAPKHLLKFIEAQVAVHYPQAHLVEVANDYSNREFPQTYGHSALLKLEQSDVFPIKTYQSFESDSLESIQQALSQLDSIEEEYWIQVLARPVDNSWHKRSANTIIKIRDNKAVEKGPSGWVKYLASAARAISKVPRGSSTSRRSVNEDQLAQISAIEDKGTKLGFETKIRITYLGNNQDAAEERLISLAAAFGPFERTHANSFKMTNKNFDTSSILEYRARYFSGKGQVMNSSELATIWHLPSQHANSAVEPIADMSLINSLATIQNTAEEELSLIGSMGHGQQTTQFGLTRDNRAQPVLVMGESGTGKTSLLTLLTLSDIYHHQGVAIFDPHGDLSHTVLSHIPSERAEQVVYLNLADTNHVPAFNPLHVDKLEHIPVLVTALTEALCASCGIFDPRSEYILRYALQALIDHPDGTLLDIEPLLLNSAFREEVIHAIHDPVVRNFWVAEYGSWDQEFIQTSTEPLLTGLREVFADQQLAMIMGQAYSSFSISGLIEQGGILLVNGAGTLARSQSFDLLTQSLLAHFGVTGKSVSTDSSVARPMYIYLDSADRYLLPALSFMFEEPHLPTHITASASSLSGLDESLAQTILTSSYTKLFFAIKPSALPPTDAAMIAQYHTEELPPRHFVMLAGSQVVEEARTLTVPPPPEDLSGLIIENSKQKFTKSSAEINQELTRKHMNISELNANITITDQKTALTSVNSAIIDSTPAETASDPTPDAPEVTPEPRPVEGQLQEDQIIHLR